MKTIKLCGTTDVLMQREGTMEINAIWYARWDGGNPSVWIYLEGPCNGVRGNRYLPCGSGVYARFQMDFLNRKEKEYIDKCNVSTMVHHGNVCVMVRFTTGNVVTALVSPQKRVLYVSFSLS